MDQADSLRQLAASGKIAKAPLKVYAVTSGKGGVGKTNITANLATVAARAGKRVLIIDADLGLANVEIVLGLKPRFHLGDLLDKSLSITDVLVEGPPGVMLLPAGSGVKSLTHLTDDQKRRFVLALEPIEDMFDLVLIDSGAGIGDNVLFFVGAAQEAILVVSPEPTSLVDAYAAVKVLSQQAGVRTFNVIINPVVDELAARGIFQKLTAVTGKFLEARVRHLGYVPRDENLHRAIMAQRPVCEMFPASPSARAITAIADRLLSDKNAPAETQTPAPAQGGLKFMWQRLFRESQAAVG
ncbi:MAG: MinD/ParA family protein [Pseudomonadota bacterium]